jgi:hypothetical protein
MAINVSTQDLENYPGNLKTVTVDQTSIVPAGYEGDEQYVQKFSTSAYSDVANTTGIQDIYVTEYITGWYKSSSFAGSGGKFNLDATHNTLDIKVDNTTTTSGSGDGYYEIVLDYNIDSTPMAGSDIAADMELKIRALIMETEDIGFTLSYLNCSVYYQDGKFWVISGSMASSYSGENRSSVKVQAGATNDCSKELGFNLSLDSQSLSGTVVTEGYITGNYTTDTTPLVVSPGTGVSVGDCLMITDGTNTDYFTALSGTTDTSIVVPIDANNSFVGIANSYTTTSGAKFQILREQDPDGMPTLWYTDIDSVVRWGIKTIVNQIDYSS